MRLKRANVLSAFVGAGLYMGAATVQASSILLDENFNDVTRVSLTCSPPLNATDTRDVSAILANCPGELPTGTTHVGITNLNVRRGDNAINTTAGPTGFDSFFNTGTGNNFLVLGDSGDNGTTAVIGDSPEQGTFSISFPFTLSSTGGSITVSFAWAFDGADTDTAAGVADIASAAIVGDSVLSLLSLSSDAALGTSGTFNQVFLTSALPTGNLSLRFQLGEHASDPTNTALGIDNVLVAPEPATLAFVVPEPATLALLGLGLAGLRLSRRGKA